MREFVTRMEYCFVLIVSILVEEFKGKVEIGAMCVPLNNRAEGANNEFFQSPEGLTRA